MNDGEDAVRQQLLEILRAANFLLSDLEAIEQGGGYLYPETRAAMDRLRKAIQEF